MSALAESLDKAFLYTGKFQSHHCQTHDQKRFTISQVAADWHELMILQRTMRPSIARASRQLDLRFAASRHTATPISPIACRLLLIFCPAEGRRLS